MTWTVDALMDLVREVVEAHRATSNTPGVGFGVQLGDEVRTGGSGTATVESRATPVNGQTLFRLCSVTKPMTSTLVGSLLDEGLMELDEPVVKWVPDLRLSDDAARESLTLRHLLLHTSGLEGEWRGDLEQYGDGDRALSSLVGDYQRLAQYAPVGAFWGYCNTGYWLAGHIAARAAGTSFEQALRDRVLTPLGMNSTALSIREVDLARMAHPHTVREGATEPVGSFAFPRCRVPSGGVISCVDDLLRFAALHTGTFSGLGSDVVSLERVNQLREPQVDAAPGERQSLGWATVIGTGPLLAGHSGSYNGYATRLLVVPDMGLAVAVLTNSDTGGQVATAVRDAVRAEVLLAPAHPRESVQPGTAELERVEGVYEHPAVEHTTVRVDGGRLAVEMTGPRRKGIGWCQAWSSTDFTITEGSFTGTDIQFLPGPDGQVRHVRVGLRLGARVS